MVDAVVDFVRRKQPKHVRSVKILIFQTVMMTEFHKSMKKREGEQVQEKGVLTILKGIFPRCYLHLLCCILGFSKINNSLAPSPQAPQCRLITARPNEVGTWFIKVNDSQ